MQHADTMAGMPFDPEPMSETTRGNSGIQKCVVIAPTYNHAFALKGVLGELDAQGLDIIAVNDGAEDQTDAVLDRWTSVGSGGPLRLVLRHEVNRGKAAALLTGFAEAMRRGYSHAATIDTDGQHDVGDLVRLIELSNHQPGFLLIGARQSGRDPASKSDTVPLASRIGRQISNWMVWAESGVRVSDSQSGMRVYPLAEREMLAAKAARYGFETEVLVRAGWNGVGVMEQGILSIYSVEGGRCTHFRLWRDTASSVLMHAGLLARAMLPQARAARLRRASRVNELTEPTTGTIPRRLANWFHPKRLGVMATGDAHQRERLAASVGVGMLMATLPIYGIKTVACLWLAARFRLHPLAVVGVSSLSTPPVGLVFVALSLYVGSVLLHGQLPDLGTVKLTEAARWSTVNTFVAEWLMGSVVAGVVLGMLAYLTMRVVLKCPRRAATVIPLDLSRGTKSEGEM